MNSSISGLLGCQVVIRLLQPFDDLDFLRTLGLALTTGQTTIAAFSLGNPESSAMDYRSIANKVSFGTSVIDLDN